MIDSILADEDRVLADPEWTIAVSELADSSVNFVVHEKIETRFDAAGISIPFPQTDVHLHDVA